MLLTEWNLDEAKEVWREEAWEEGREAGREEGREAGWVKGTEAGREYFLGLLNQGLSIDEIKLQLETGSMCPVKKQ